MFHHDYAGHCGTTVAVGNGHAIGTTGQVWNGDWLRCQAAGAARRVVAGPGVSIVRRHATRHVDDDRTVISRTGSRVGRCGNGDTGGLWHYYAGHSSATVAVGDRYAVRAAAKVRDGKWLGGQTTGTARRIITCPVITVVGRTAGYVDDDGAIIDAAGGRCGRCAGGNTIGLWHHYASHRGTTRSIGDGHAIRTAAEVRDGKRLGGQAAGVARRVIACPVVTVAGCHAAGYINDDRAVACAASRRSRAGINYQTVAGRADDGRESSGATIGIRNRQQVGAGSQISQILRRCVVAPQVGVRECTAHYRSIDRTIGTADGIRGSKGGQNLSVWTGYHVVLDESTAAVIRNSYAVDAGRKIVQIFRGGELVVPAIDITTTAATDRLIDTTRGGTVANDRIDHRSRRNWCVKRDIHRNLCRATFGIRYRHRVGVAGRHLEEVLENGAVRPLVREARCTARYGQVHGIGTAARRSHGGHYAQAKYARFGYRDSEGCRAPAGVRDRYAVNTGRQTAEILRRCTVRPLISIAWRTAADHQVNRTIAAAGTGNIHPGSHQRDGHWLTDCRTSGSTTTGPIGDGHAIRAGSQVAQIFGGRAVAPQESEVSCAAAYRQIDRTVVAAIAADVGDCSSRYDSWNLIDRSAGGDGTTSIIRYRYAVGTVRHARQILGGHSVAPQEGVARGTTHYGEVHHPIAVFRTSVAGDHCISQELTCFAYSAGNNFRTAVGIGYGHGIGTGRCSHQIFFSGPI